VIIPTEVAIINEVTSVTDSFAVMNSLFGQVNVASEYQRWHI